MISGIDRNVSTGFTNDVMTPRIAATSSSGTRSCSISAQPWRGPPGKAMPSSSHAATPSPSAVVRSRRMIRMGASLAAGGRRATRAAAPR